MQNWVLLGFYQRDTCDCIGRTQDAAYHERLFECQCVKEHLVEDGQKHSQTREANKSPEDSEEAYQAKVLEEEGLPEAVPCSKDDGRQDDGEEDVIVELYL